MCQMVFIDGSTGGNVVVLTAAPGKVPTRGWVDGALVLLARTLAQAQVFPDTAVRVALGVQNLWTRVFGSIQLEHHPLRIRNTRIRRAIEQPDVVVRKFEIYRTDVIVQLFRFA